MATTPPLHGMRIIECSVLGPAAVTSALVDLGADVIKIEPPNGDYVREMTWPIIEGNSLLHLHINRGKRSLVLDLRTEAGVAIFKELAQDADAVVEAMRPGALARRGVGFEDLQGAQPQDRLLHHLGLRDDRPVPRLPQPRHRLRHLGGHRQRGRGRRGLHLHPRARVHRHQRRADLRRARHPGCRHPRPPTGEGSHIDLAQSDAAAAVDWYRSETWRAYERPDVGGDRQQVRQLRAARPGHGRHGGGGALPGLQDQGPPARALHGVRAGLLEELLRRRGPHGPLRALARLQVRRPCAGQP